MQSADELSRLDESPRPSRARGRVLLAVAACVALVAALSVAIVFWRTGDQSDPASPADQLVGVTWAMPGGTLVFTDDSVRILDGGCSFSQRQATITDGVLEFGTEFDHSDCLGRETPEDPMFARIATSETPLAWQRTGDLLDLTDDHGVTVRFHRDGPAWYLAGPDWVLEYFVGPDDYEQPGDPTARLHIDHDGTVRATDVCNDLTGTAVVTDSTVTFTDMRSTDRACSDPRSAALAKVVDQVLSGPATYSIVRDGLTVSDEAGNLLIYTSG